MPRRQNYGAGSKLQNLDFMGGAIGSVAWVKSYQIAATQLYLVTFQPFYGAGYLWLSMEMHGVTSSVCFGGPVWSYRPRQGQRDGLMSRSSLFVYLSIYPSV